MVDRRPPVLVGCPCPDPTEVCGPVGLRPPSSGHERPTAALAEARLDRFLAKEPVVWLSTVRPDGAPHLVPIWFTWDGTSLLVFSKPGAQKVRNLRANPVAMLALGEPEDDFDVALAEARVELFDGPATELPDAHLAKYADRMAALGLSPEEFLATYSQVLRDHADPLAAVARPDDASERARRRDDRGAGSRGGPPHARRGHGAEPEGRPGRRRSCGAAAAVVVAPPGCGPAGTRGHARAGIFGSGLTDASLARPRPDSGAVWLPPCVGGISAPIAELRPRAGIMCARILLVRIPPSRDDDRGQLRRFRKSERISRAAFLPGCPVTPPPGWAPDPARYSPSSPKR